MATSRTAPAGLPGWLRRMLAIWILLLTGAAVLVLVYAVGVGAGQGGVDGAEIVTLLVIGDVLWLHRKPLKKLLKRIK